MALCNARADVGHQPSDLQNERAELRDQRAEFRDPRTDAGRFPAAVLVQSRHVPDRTSTSIELRVNSYQSRAS